MKKNLALILALTMILGSLFCVAPMAEGEEDVTVESTGRYIPEIAYANVNYTDGIYMMFAVEAPAELAENESVKLIVWDSRDDSLSFSYLDTIKDVIDAEAEKLVVGDKEYLVFKYSGLDATDMTNVICARAVLIKDGVATSYGKLVDYSIVEYVESAKGNIEGIEGIADEELIKTLDSMLEFGSFAQEFSGDEYEYLASDDLKTIYSTNILNGIDKGRTLVGFFKYEEGNVITIRAPFFDGTGVTKITYADGTEIADLDEYKDDLQIMAVDGNIEIVCHYKNAIARSFNADVFGFGMESNNNGEVVGGNNLVSLHSNGYMINYKGYGSANVSGVACVKDSYGRMNYWNAIKTVASPIPGDDTPVFQFTATNSPAYTFTNVTPADFAGVGFGDTIYPAFTFEMTLGAVNGKMPTVGTYYFRHRFKAADVDNGSWTDLSIFKIKNGQVLLLDGDQDDTNNPVVGTIPETGMAKFAITVDALTGMTYGYAENVETGVMEKTSESQLMLNSTFLGRQTAHFKNLADEDPSNDETLAMYENIYTFFTKSTQLEPTWVFGAGSATNAAFEASSIEIDGVEVPVFSGEYDANGAKIFNMDAVKAVAERDYSFLLDDFNLVMGYVYE